MPANDRNPGNARLPPKLLSDPRLDIKRITQWVIATFGALIVTTVVLFLLRALLHNYAFDQGEVQVNTMNLPLWASTPVSWMIGAGIVTSLPALFRLFTTGAVNRGERW